jgi:biopolymer transport protein ExbB
MDTLILIALVVTSLTAVTFIVERGLALRIAKVVPPPITDAVLNYTGIHDLVLLKSVCTQNPSPISRLLLFSADHLDMSKEENSSLVETRARFELSKLERGLVVLEIIVSIAPLMGLVGTIFGLITLFAAQGLDAAANDHSRFAQGISVALYATLMGLLIAIPALISWSYYSRKIETFAVRMESLCEEFLRKHYRTESASHYGAAVAEVAPPPLPSTQPALVATRSH